jgi:signal transduction histidine kinase
MTEPVNLAELKEIKSLPLMLEQIAAQAQCVIRLLPLTGTPIIEKFPDSPTTSSRCSSEGRCREIVEAWLNNTSKDDLTCACGHSLTVFPIHNQGRVNGILTACPATPEQEPFLQCFANLISNCLSLARNAVELWSEHSDLLAAHRELYSETESLSDDEAIPEIALRIIQKYLKADVALYLPRSTNGKGWEPPVILKNVDVSKDWLTNLSTLIMTSHDQDRCPLIILEENQDHYPEFAELKVSSFISATVLCEREVSGRLVFCSAGDASMLSFSDLALLENLGSTIGLRIHDLRTRRLKERFFESALHQISTPAHSVLAIARLLATQKDKSTQDSEQWLRDLNSEAERLARLAEKARGFSLLQKPTRSVIAVSLNKLAEDVARGIRPLARARQVSIDTVLPEKNYEVMADGEGLYLALQSLVENALKFSPSGASVQIILTKEGGDYKVSVNDQGPGVPESQKVEIFKELVSIARAEVPESTGMGLAIAQSVINAHGGLLDCHDIPGQPGACFWFTIPGSERQ